MKILSLKLFDGLSQGEYNFSEITVIFSHHNKAGKTTLLRCILYGLGYPIPSIRGISFDNIEFETRIMTHEKHELLLKRKKAVMIIEENGLESKHYFLPSDQLILQQEIFGIDDTLILNNLLGTFYFDQEKGWTLLNRGKVIANIQFHIEDLLIGLTGKPCLKEKNELKKVEQEIKKYKQMLEVAKYQVEFDESGDAIPFETPTEELKQEILFLQNQKRPLDNELTRLQNVIKKTTTFKNYISSMKLRVKGTNGDEIQVTADTLIGFRDHEELLHAKQEEIIYEISKIDNKINNLKNRIDDTHTLFRIETEIEHFASALSQIRVNKQSVEHILEQLSEKQKKLHETIQIILMNENNVVNDMTESVINYLIELGIPEKYGQNIFTKDLKSLSGATFHLLVFAFKISYIKMIYKKTGCILPIIIDSPNGREVEKSLVNKMMNILVRDFSIHQVIIATIYNPNLETQNTIILDNGIMTLRNEE